MTCNNCGGAVELIESTGGVTAGPFTERYECVDCGATGTVSGESSDAPRAWRRTGPVFGGVA